MSHITPYSAGSSSSIADFSQGQPEYERLLGMLQAIRMQDEEILDLQLRGIQADQKVSEIAPEAVTASAEKIQQQSKRLVETMGHTNRLLLTHAANKKKQEELIEQQKLSIIAKQAEIDERTKICDAGASTLMKISQLVPNLLAIEEEIQTFQNKTRVIL